MTKQKTEISCIGIAYIQPILDLYYKLSNIKFTGNSKIRVSIVENGYSVSIVSLIVFCIESLINNLKYHKNAVDRFAIKFFKSNYSNYNDLAENLNELFTLRNAIVHNHIWIINYNLNNKYNEINIKKKLLDGYGNLAFNEVIDIENKVTKKLKLRIIPTKIGLKEAKQALIILKKFSDFLDKQQKPFISNNYFIYNSKEIKFSDFIKKYLN